ncbi:unnamed protein product [Linum trigynum]|uniref:CCHC-type domain-containing protein n=1 Tax=Linum trigynum TaxID=586398 RepID=A0AAV2F9N7_9ROSI
MALRQDRSSVSTFYAKLKRLWDDWLMLDPSAKCTCGNCSCNVEQRTRESHEAMRLLDFLVGLDENYSIVRTHLLSLKPPPSLGEAYHAVANDEQQRNIKNYQRPRVDAAAFQGQGERSASEDRTNDGCPKCSHCGKVGHYRETCYDIIGWPPKSAEKGDRSRRRNQQQCQSRQDPQAAAVELSQLSVPGFSAEQVEQLKAFLSAGPPSSNTQPKANMSGLTLQEDDWDG